MGYSPRAEIFDVTLSIPTVALQLRDWKRAREDAQKLMIKVQKKWTKGKEPEQRYKTGDQVWLEGRNLWIDQPSVKLAPKCHGSVHDTYPQGRPGVARPSKARTKNIGRKEC